MKNKEKIIFYAGLFIFVSAILIGAMCVGYNLASEYRETIVHTIENTVDSLKATLSKMEDEVRNITANESEQHKIYTCKICGWVYDPTEGDPKQDIEKDTPFLSVPNDWLCPTCGAAKTDFAESKGS